MGRPDSVSFPGGTRSYSYDALLRTTNITAPGMNYSYPLYDKAGNILTKQTEHGTYGYGYDDLYRLTGANAPAANETYDYDPVGNRLSAPGVSGQIDHNQNNELRQYGDTSFDYDPNGNLTSETTASGTRQYIYNVQNRLIRVEENGQPIAEYGYDPFGRRLWKDVSGVRTYFFYSDEGLVAEYDAAGNELRSYGYRPDSTWGTNPLWLKEGEHYYWYQNDHLGTPQKLVDSAGVVVWSATYSTFGEAQVQVEAVTNNLRFPGQYYDAETGWHYNFHRYYDPGTGRYTRVDPIGFDGGDVNLYAYVLNNSINASDPAGLAVAELTMGGFAVGGPPGALAGHIVGLGIVATGYLACRANGGCELPDEIPLLDLGAPPSNNRRLPENTASFAIFSSAGRFLARQSSHMYGKKEREKRSRQLYTS